MAKMRIKNHRQKSVSNYPQSFLKSFAGVFFLLQTITSTAVSADNTTIADSLLLTDESISLWQLPSEALSSQPVWERSDIVSNLAPISSQQQLLIGSSSGLFALDRNDGSIRWKFRGDDLIYTPVIQSSALHSHDIAYAASRDGKLRALNTEDGALLWQKNLSGWIYSPALIDGTLVTGGSASKLWGINRDNGTILWQRDLPGELVTAPITLGSDRVITTTFSGHLLVLNARDGEIIWQHKLTSAATHITTNGKSIYSSGYDGVVHAIDAHKGTKVWQSDRGGDRNQQLQITGSALLVINDLGWQRLDLNTGSLIARRNIDGEPIGSTQFVANEYWIFYRQNGSPKPIRLNL